MESDIHVLPVKDLREHEESRTCWCQPVIDLTGRTALVVHQALDGRELVEQHGLQ